MRKILFLLTLFVSPLAMATAVDGSVFYLTSDNRLVEREATLEVPSRGQGEVVLAGRGFEWRTENFWTVQSKGKTIFYASFLTEFRGFQSTIVFRGSCLKGDNRLMYYGDFYKKPGHDASSRSMDEFTYEGGFAFDFDRN